MAAPGSNEGGGDNRGTADEGDSAATRAAANEAPPFATWNKIYVFVAGVLAIQVVVYTVLTHVMK
ncbi:MAG TPA: hypothetical protein VGG33_24905 [Polyangia bacterium]